MRVDVILPVYNGSRWIDEAIESVVDQTYADWHLTVIDDGSADDSALKVEAFRKRMPDRITLLRHSRNVRAAACRMEAVAQTSGEVIAFIDQDDRWAAAKLEKQIEHLEQEPEVHAVHTDVTHIDELGMPIAGGADRENALRASVGYGLLPRRELCATLFLDNSIRLVSAVVRRQAFLAVGGFDARLFGGEDWEFWVRFSNRWRIAHLPEALVLRRIHATNASQHYFSERTGGLMTALDLVLEGLPQLRPLGRERRSGLLGRQILSSLETGDYATARGSAMRLLREGPYRPINAACVTAGLLGPAGRALIHLQRRLMA